MQTVNDSDPKIKIIVKSRNHQNDFKTIQSANSLRGHLSPQFSITTKQGLMNSQKTLDFGYRAFKDNSTNAQSDVLNDVRNLHYRGVRHPSLTTFAGAVP